MNYFNNKQDINNIRLRLLLLLVLVFTWISETNGQNTGDDCITIPFSSDSLIKVNKSNGNETTIGNIGVKRVQAIALNPTADTIYAARPGQLGIVTFSNTQFKALPQPFGTGDGSQGNIEFIEVEGLSFDIETNTLYGSVKVEEPLDDILIKIDPKSGAHIPDAFGLGMDYVTISGPGVFSIIEDIAVNPINGEMYGLSREELGNDILIKINKEDGTSSVIGPAGINLLEGLGFDSQGNLYATPGLNTSLPPRFFNMDLNSGEAVTVGELSSMDYESCDCLAVNRNPDAVDDHYTTQIDSLLQIEAPGVLSNDQDPDGDSLIIVAYDTITMQGGMVQIGTDGSFSYTPPEGFEGTDSLTYTIEDGNDGQDTGSVTINVTIDGTEGEEGEEGEEGDTVVIILINNPPIAVDDEYSTDQDLEIEITDPEEGILANDSDPDGDLIAALEVTDGITDQGGRISINSDGTLVYTPDLGFTGTDTYEYTVCDDQDPSLCDSAIIYIEVRELPIVVFNAFSPNGDGINDTWVIQGITRFPDNTVQIFNRWGNLIFETTGYDNTAKVWNGESTEGMVFGGNDAPDGAYYYIIDLGDGSERLKGYVVVRR